MMRYESILLWAGAAMAAPAHSAVTDSSEAGFAVGNSVAIAADGATVYRLLIEPARRWHGAHSYSGDAANLTLEARAGGCFCETLRVRAEQPGSVEHGRVIYVAPGERLRISGALGPLQAEAATGTLSFDIVPAAKGVRVTMSYVVGGYIRMGAAKMAPLVDQVMTEQLARLKRASEAAR